MKSMSNLHVRSNGGFTIVELLIVIVVIAILAAISIVAYNGIQQRATNSSIISSVGQTIKLIKAYQATYGTYPAGSSLCYTLDNQCTNYNNTVVTANNSSLIIELNKIGSPVGSVPQTASNTYGIYVDYYLPRTFNHDKIPGLIMYHLKGINQDCGVPNVAVNDPAPLAGEANPFISSSTGYTAGNSGGNTRCWVSV